MLALLVFTYAIPAAALQARDAYRRDYQNASMGKTYVQTLTNVADSSYIGEIVVGGQKIKSIFDTGSFELLVFGKRCGALCGKRHLYDHSRSPTAHVSELRTMHKYGGGACESISVYDNVGFAGFAIPQQQFWEVFDADIYTLEAGAFQAIFGLGPPASAGRLREQEKIEARKELMLLRHQAADAELIAHTAHMTHHRREIDDFTSQTSTSIQNLKFQDVSFCFGKDSGSDGYVFWDDHAPRDESRKFLTLDVVGNPYWSLELSSVTLSAGLAPEHKGKKSSAKHWTEASIIGCAQGNCSAIFDTGTSLITAPSEAVSAVDKLANKWKAAGGTCDDLSALPELMFLLNGHEFVLPPESYMGVVEGSMTAELLEFMPHLHQHFDQRRQGLGQKEKNHSLTAEENVSSCAPLLVSVDAESEFGKFWVFGVPFFRQYYSAFHFMHHPTGPPTASSMSFSIPDGHCMPSKKPSSRTPNKLTQLYERTGSHARSRPATMRVDAAKLRVPPLVHSLRRQASSM